MGFLHGFFAVTVLLCILGYAYSDDPDYCNSGFKLAYKYHGCWTQATYSNKYPDLYEQHDEYTGTFVEKYAIHMCSTVKPVALKCLEEEVKECSNVQKIVGIADESGGACEKNHLNPFFKKHIIDHLVSIPGDSPCFQLSDTSYECYSSAGEKIIQSNMYATDISHFHKVADRFFDAIWECMIDVFKSNEDICEHWQLPMLMSLQKTAMPSLFGMRLNNYQVSKLGLENATYSHTTTAAPHRDEDCEKQDTKTYILIKALASKPEAEEGEVVLEIDTPAHGPPEVSVARGSEQDQKDIRNFVDQITDSNKLSLKELCKKGKEQRKKNRDLKKYLKKIRDSQKKKEQKLKNNKEDDHVVSDEQRNILHNSMIQ